MNRDQTAPGRLRGCIGDTPYANYMAVAAERTRAAIRAAKGRTSAGRTASPATATERSGWLIGLSSRSHAVAITAAGMSEVTSVLRNTRLAAGERDGEIVAGMHNGDRDPGRNKSEELWLRTGRRLDVHERDATT